MESKNTTYIAKWLKKSFTEKSMDIDAKMIMKSDITVKTSFFVRNPKNISDGKEVHASTKQKLKI